jgi:polysaccharide export outer membrane protein
LDSRSTRFATGCAWSGLAFVCWFVAGLALTAPAHGQMSGTPVQPSGSAPAPVAVNVPGGVVPDARQGRIDVSPTPIAPNAPRVGPPAAGQVVADDYRIGPQDLIEIQVFGIDSLRREVRVNSRGAISLPLVGMTIVGGLTAQEAETLIATRYEKDYLQDPQVSVFIKEFTSQRITIEGAVGHPGIFPIRGQTTLLQAIAIAGGQGQMADLNEIMVYRIEGSEKKIYKYDLLKIRAGETEDPTLVNDDVVVVKRSADRVVLRDSLLSDFFGLFNPFTYARP